MPPFEIDLIEVLYGTGEVSMTLVLRMAGDPSRAWRVVSEMVRAKTAAVWAQEPGGDRLLADWEVAGIVRSRLGGSIELIPADDCLCLRSAARTREAYETDYANWYYEKGPGAGPS